MTKARFGMVTLCCLLIAGCASLGGENDASSSQEPSPTLFMKHSDCKPSAPVEVEDIRIHSMELFPEFYLFDAPAWGIVILDLEEIEPEGEDEPMRLGVLVSVEYEDEIVSVESDEFGLSMRFRYVPGVKSFDSDVTLESEDEESGVKFKVACLLDPA